MLKKIIVSRLKAILPALLLFGVASLIHAQPSGLDLKVFGYFQVSLGYRNDIGGPVESKSFNLQQLNLFLQEGAARFCATMVERYLCDNKIPTKLLA
jgi:hypothetical protein